ncbi:hypothetical protein Tco_1338363 [Tanacetum coccineum]
MRSPDFSKGSNESFYNAWDRSMIYFGIFIELRSWWETFLDKMPARMVKNHTESKSKDIVRALLLDKKRTKLLLQLLHLSEAVELCFVLRLRGAHLIKTVPATHGNVYRDNFPEYSVPSRCKLITTKFVTANTASTSGSGTLPGNTVTNPREDLKGITTRSGVAYQGPPIPTSSVVKPIPRVTKGQCIPSCSQRNPHPSKPPGWMKCIALADLGAAN